MDRPAGRGSTGGVANAVLRSDVSCRRADRQCAGTVWDRRHRRSDRLGPVPHRSRLDRRAHDRWSPGAPVTASAVSQKFHPTLRTQGITLEGPPKRAGGAVPVANEVFDAGCTKPVGCIARAGAGLALQDAEPDFDLVQPRGMEWKKLEAHTRSEE